MNIIISEVTCGNRNCIGVEPYCTKPPNPNIIIEDYWDLPQAVIEDSMIGLVSHETIEWLLSNILFNEDYFSIHDLIGTVSKIEQYIGNYDGLVITNKLLLVKQKKR